MNIAHIILIIAVLESSFGKKMIHPHPSNHGWTGISDIAIKDLNDRAGHAKYKAADMTDRDICFRASAEHINNYLKIHPDWTLVDILLFWRCGVRGMHHPNAKQLEYMDNGVNRYEKLINGDLSWRY